MSLKTSGISKYFISSLIGLSILLCIVTPSNAQFNVYYGHLHNHSNVSDGTGTPSQAYDYAKNVAGLDFFSLADHASSISSAEWNTIINAANSYNEDGVFTTFWGFEWSSSSNYGHVAVINTPDYCTSTDPSTNTFDELVTWLSSRDGVAFFNHPGREDDLGREFNHFSSAPSPQFVGMELFNKSNDFSVFYYNDGYYSGDGNKGFYDEALERGWNIGASGSDDNHSGTWGTATDYRMAVLAEAKTRPAIYNAIKAKRFFSTLDKNITMSFEMNNQQMGSTINAGNCDCVIDAADGDSEIFTMIQLIQNGLAIETWYPDQTTPFISYNLYTYDGEYYYVKVTQEDGDEAISSPIFIVDEAPPDIDPPLPNPMTWLDPPQAIDSSSVTMTATTATDENGVEYYFTCVSGGGHDSGWQTSTTYIDAGLQPDTQYTYTVKARDLSINQNETTPSDPASATTSGVVNNPPSFTSDPVVETEATESVPYSSSIADDATDPDTGDILSFFRISGPVWLSVAPDGTLSGTPEAADIGLNVFMIRVEDNDGAFDEASLEITVNPAGQPIDYFATGESTIRGQVSGSFINTKTSNDICEAITEEIKAGKWSLLEHTWTFEITGNVSMIFYVEAYHSANIEGDDFVFAYSTDNLVFTDMLVVSKTGDDNNYQGFVLPPYTTGKIYIRVSDTDHTRAHTGIDTIYIDHMFIRSSNIIQQPGIAFAPDPADGIINVALNTVLTWSDGEGAQWHNVYLGIEPENLQLMSQCQSDTTYDPGPLQENTTYYWRIDEVNSAGTTTGIIWSFTTTDGSCTPSKIFVDSVITDTIKGSAGCYFGQAIVKVIDDCGNPVQGADVIGHFTGDFGNESPQTVTSDQNGEAVFVTVNQIKKPVFSFLVDDVNADGLIWIPFS